MPSQRTNASNHPVLLVAFLIAGTDPRDLSFVSEDGVRQLCRGVLIYRNAHLLSNVGTFAFTVLYVLTAICRDWRPAATTAS